MIFNIIDEWLGLSNLLSLYPAYFPLAYCIVGIFGLFVAHIFWSILFSIFSIFDSKR